MLSIEEAKKTLRDFRVDLTSAHFEGIAQLTDCEVRSTRTSIKWTLDNFNTWWNNKLVDQKVGYERPLRNVAKVAGIQFLNVFGGRPIEDPIEDYTKPVIALWGYCKLAGDYLFPDACYPHRGHTLALKQFTKMNVTEWKFAGPFSTSRDVMVTGTQEESINVSTQNCLDWYNGMHAALEDEQRIETTLHYLAYLALYMMRRIVKDDSHLERHLLAKAPKNFVSFFALKTPVEVLAVHHADSHEQIALALKKGNVSSQTLVAYVAQAISHDGNPAAVGVLKSSCFLALAYVGMPALQWLYRAAAKLGISHLTLMCYMLTEKHRAFADNYFEHLRAVMGRERRDVVWCLGHLIEESAWSCFSSATNKQTVATLVFIVHGTDDRDIWDAPSLRGITPYERQSAFHESKAIFDIIDTLKSTKTYSAGAGAVQERIRQQKDQGLEYRAPPRIVTGLAGAPEAQILSSQGAQGLIPTARPEEFHDVAWDNFE